MEIGCICDPLAARTDEWLRRQSLHNSWSFLDAVWCINLREREDRYLHSLKEFHAAGLCLRVQFYHAERPTAKALANIGSLAEKNPGAYGCWQSHKTLVESSFQPENPSKLVLVLEDDVHFEQDFLTPKTLGAIGRYLQQGSDADMDMFYLGYFSIFGWPDKPLTIGALSFNVKAFMTHAYIMTQSGANRFLKNGVFGQDNHIHIDHWFMHNMKQKGIYPQLAVQNNSPSSNYNGINVKSKVSESNDYPLILWLLYHCSFIIDIFFGWCLPAAIVSILLTTAIAMISGLRSSIQCLVICTLAILVGCIILATVIHI